MDGIRKHKPGKYVRHRRGAFNSVKFDIGSKSSLEYKIWNIGQSLGEGEVCGDKKIAYAQLEQCACLIQ